MNIEKILVKANKYDYKVDMNKYENVINWIQDVKEIDIDRDRPNMLTLMELEKEVDEAEIQWLKHHSDELIFDTELVDKGFAFVDVMTITNKKGNEILTIDFYGDGEAQEFMEMLYQSI